MKTNNIRLGINIDHAATLRNARAENDPVLSEVAIEAQYGGADLITMHLREDRRHIVDSDLLEIKKAIKIPINLEMALTDEMITIALDFSPKSICVVPEKREEITTEGGFDIEKHFEKLERTVPLFEEKGIDVFLFVEASEQAIELSSKLHVTGVEVHTGTYAHSFFNTKQKQTELAKILKCAQLCEKYNIEFHAGHGLNYNNIFDLLPISNLTEVNIGHSILARSVITGMHSAVSNMKSILETR